MNEELKKRLKVWRAMSDLFLDTEIEDHIFKNVAKSVIESGYTPDETKNILWYEVFPVLEGNLSSPAGVWEGWPDEWLLNHLKIEKNPYNAINNSAGISSEIKRCWAYVAKYLPAEYA